MIVSYETYPAYKKSGSKWVDKIPHTWEVVPLKHVLSIPITDGPHLTPKFIDEGVPFVSAEAVSGGYINFEKIRGFISHSDDALFSQKYQPKKNDVYMIKSGATTGITAIVDTEQHFNIWSPLAAMRCKETYHPRYLLNYLRSEPFQRSVQLSWTYGTQQNIGMSTLENLIVCFPKFKEQQKIANFLDHETAKIDTLIEKQQQLIKLLEEKRQAVISHAVTRGLNPNAPMRDSGIEWLGEVPEHWEVMKFAHCAMIRNGQIDPTEEPYCNFTLVAPNHIQSKTGRLIAQETAVSQGADSGKYLCKEGEVIYSKIRPALAKVCISPNNQTICSADMYPIRGTIELTNKFLFWSLLSGWFTSLVILESDRVAMPKINREKLAGVKLPIPPKNEQKEINAVLTHKTENIDSLLLKAKKTISLMKERRTAVISAAVTGKIDVRNWQAPNK